MAALTVADDAEDAYGGGYAQMGLGLLALRQGSPDEACRSFALAFARAAALKDPLTMFAVLLHWWQARWQRREERAAFAQARKCIRLACRHGNERTQRELLGALANLANDCGERRLAARWQTVATGEPGCAEQRTGRARRAGARISNALAGAEAWLARRADRR